MPTVRWLLDNYGQPPPEVVRDWSQQIQQVLGQLASAQPLAQNLLSQGDLLLAQDWTALQVDEDGLLDPHELNAVTAHAALEDLSSWTTPVTQLTTDSLGRNPPNEVTANTPIDSVLPIPRNHVSRTKRGTTRKTSHRRAHLVVIASAALIVLTLGTLLLLPSKTPTDQSAQLSQPKDDKQSTSFAQLEKVRPANNPARSEAELELDLSSTVDGNSLLNGIEAVSPPSKSSLESLSQLAPAAALAPTSPAESTTADSKSDDQANPVQTQLDAAQSAASLAAPAQPQTITTANEVDLLAQVAQSMRQAELAQSSATQPSDTAPDGSSDSAAEQRTNPPWMLTRDDMLIKQFAPRDLQPKPRQLYWTLMIPQAEGFLIEPAASQTVGPQALAIWHLFDANAQSPRACLTVLARNRGNRDNAIELQFFGGAEDMPELRIPLNRKWLDPLRANVRGYSVQLRATQEQLSSAFVPSPVKGQLAASKQWIAGQLKLAERLNMVIAEVDQLADLIDAQLPCHAVLRANIDSPVLAQWGEPLEAP